ncbi:LemA family protein, partial [Streptococcus agalactiae]|nr:LemA family protein [Streptococcus agalactiae]
MAIIALFVIWLIVAYNSLVRSRMHTKESWSQIDVQLKRRNDLIPNLIETVKGYAAYEGKTLEKIAELRAQVAKANTPAEAMTASNELTRQLSSILAVAENYPDLKANNSFVKLQEELTNT